jgi:hypothetical protein
MTNTRSENLKVSGWQLKKQNNKEVYAESQLVYLWELNHPKDEPQRGLRDEK